MKKLAQSVLMAVCMMLVFLPITVLAAEQPTSGTCGDGVTWTYEPSLNSYGRDEGGTLTISGNGKMEDFGLGSRLPPWPTAVRNVIIEPGVTSIGSNVFNNRYSKLTKVIIPNGVVSIGESAFGYCSSLTEITLPDSVVSIGYRAFNYCSELTKINIPNSVLVIGANAFSGCTSLSRIEIPASVIRIEQDIPFYQIKYLSSGCDSLEEIWVDPNNKVYSSYDGILYNKDQSIMFDCPAGKTSCKISNNVIEITDSAFAGCSYLSNIEIPSTVTKIGEYAFANCNSLNTVKISDGVSEVANGLFYNCTSLTDITIPDSVRKIGFEAFEGCSALTNIAIPNNVEEISNMAFWNCSSLKDIVIPGKVSKLPSIFTGCTSLKSLTIPEGITILQGTFSDSQNLEVLYLPSSISKIEENTFANCWNLKNIFYAGSEEQWKSIPIETKGNEELSLATITYNSITLPTNPDTPNAPTVPTQPGTLQLTTADGGLGKKVTVTVTGGHWLTIQVRRAGSVAISSLQAPGSGSVSVTFSAASGSTVQVWETAEEMSFANGIPENQILNTATRDL